MKERPILFSSPMVRAILDGRKTQTRRVVTPQPTAVMQGDITRRWFDGDRLLKGYGVVGDRLWVRHAPDIFPVYYKAIAGWEDRYAAGTDGVIYRTDRGEPTPLKGSPTSKGYLTVSLSRGEWETKAVHKLVCATFYGDPPFEGAEVRHMDGDQTNNRPENLDWGTQQQNRLDRNAHGRAMGEQHHCAKLTEAEVLAIRASGASQRALAARYGVAQATIHSARSGLTWGDHEQEPRNTKAFRMWRPSIHMPRWACRILLEITDVRVQRLQEISLADIDAEGFPGPHQPPDGPYLDWFVSLWDSINAKRAPWDSNPWVWAITFRRIEA